jgi:large subunit ribosomal protein L29
VKVDELRVLEGDELSGRLKTARRELYELRFKHAVGQLENWSQIAKVRHDIARLLTVLNERELGISSIQEAPPAVVAETAVAKKKPRPKRAEFVDEEAEPAEPEAVAAETEAEPEAVAAEPEKPKRARRTKAEKDS